MMDRNTAPLTFAWDEHGALRHVDEVSNGLACGCTCPTCGARLVARQGSQTTHHFSHEGGSNCGSSGVETALHMAAKKILTSERRMMLPALEENAQAKDSSGHSHSAMRRIPAKSVSFDHVSVEVALGGVIPDIAVTIAGRTLVIEVAVSHFAEDAKVDFLRACGIAAVEIDLSGTPTGWSWASLTNAIVDDASGKKWLFNPKSEALRAEALREAEALAAKADRQNALRKARIHESHELQRVSVPGFAAEKARLAEFLSPANLAAERARMEFEGPSQGPWLAAARMLGANWQTPPAYINISVPGEMGLPVDRRVWQGGLFVLFIRGNRRKTFSIKSAVSWCEDTFGCRRREFMPLYKHKHLLTIEEERALPSTSRAVCAYLRALEGSGFIKRKGDHYQIVSRFGS